MKKVYLFQMIAFKNICYNKNSLLFQLVAINIYQKQSLGGVP